MQLKYGNSRILSWIRLFYSLIEHAFIHHANELNDHAIHKDLVSETELDYNTGNEKVKLISFNTAPNLS